MPDPTSSVAEFIDAALQPEQLPGAMERVAKALGAGGMTLVAENASGQTMVCSPGIAGLVDQYLKRDWVDPREKRVNPDLSQGFLTDFDHFTAAELESYDHYRRFLRPNGFGWHAAASLYRAPDAMLVVSLKRRYSDGPYDGADLRLINQALPYLRAAARSAYRVWDRNNDDVLEAFGRLGRGALLLDGNLRVIAHNRAFVEGNGLLVQHGRLSTQHPGDQSALGRLITDTLALLDPGSRRAPECITIRRTHRQPPLLLEGLMLGQRQRNLFSKGRMLLLITDPSITTAGSVERLQMVFNLTPREAQIAAALGSGSSLHEVSAELGISIGHARQRLKTIFAKTGTTRQAELVAVLSRMR